MRLSIFITAIFLCIKTLTLAQSTTIEIQTNLGNMRFQLYDDTPKHKNEFIRLAKEGYYDGTLFYRVVQDFLIQGGSKSSKNAPAGKRIGYGSPEHTVDDEILPQYFHKKGALCAPRQNDEVNPFKQSDISQFYIVEGKKFSMEQLDTLELFVNIPIKKQVSSQVYSSRVKANLKALKTEIQTTKDTNLKRQKAEEFNDLIAQIKSEINARVELNPKSLQFSPQQRKAYTTIGGYPDLDGKYTVFGECISGFDVIDKISKLKTDANNRPYTDVKITVKIIN